MKEQENILKNSKETDSICEPDKGWYSEKDPACRLCKSWARGICQLFAVEKGLKKPHDIIRIPKE